MATSVPVPMARPRSAWASAAASLTPSPTIATTLPSACSRLTTSTLSAGSTSAITVVDADLGGDRRGRRPRCRRSAAPGVRPSARSRATASADVGLTVSATDEDAAGPAVPADRDGGAPPALGRAGGAASSSAGSCSAASASSARPADHDRRARRRLPRDAEALEVGEVRDRRQVADRSRAAAAIGPGDRVLGGVPRARRRGAARSSRVLARRRRRRRRGSSAPVVTVPVLSSTTVSTRRVDSSTSGPLIRMPSWAPRPVPTSSAVGVARPRAHGQAMISTATAAVNAAADAGAGAEPEAERGDGERDHDRARRRRRSGRPAAAPAALPVCASSTSRAICASWVSAPTRVARTTSRPPALTVAPTTASPGADLDRHRLAGEHRGVDRGGARRRPRRRWRSSRRAGPRTGRRRRSWSIGIRVSAPSPRARRRPWRRARAAPAARRRPGAWTGPRSSGRPG